MALAVFGVYLVLRPAKPSREKGHA
jgi:hypothetical protein